MIFYYDLEIGFLKFTGLLFISILITSGASFGVGLIIASATIKYRDFRYVMPFFLQTFFFLSPVVYPLSLFSSEPLRLILSLNPLAGAISISRSALSNNAVDWNTAVYGILMTVFLLIAG